MHRKHSESGMALIVTLLLGLIAAIFIGALLYIVSSSTQVSGIDARHTSALQAANGGASLIQDRLFDGDLVCDDGTDALPCHAFLHQDKDWSEENATVDIEDMGNYDIEAKMLSAYEENDQDKTIEIYSFNVVAASTGFTEERSEIEFVYKIEWED